MAPIYATADQVSKKFDEIKEAAFDTAMDKLEKVKLMW